MSAHVPDEAVEAARKVAEQEVMFLSDDDVRELLTAAAPFIRAKGEREHRASALEDAARAELERCAGDWQGAVCDRCKEAARRLRDRAAAEREGGADHG